MPIGHAVNPNIAWSPASVHQDARRRRVAAAGGLPLLRLSRSAITTSSATHVPGRTDIWERSRRRMDQRRTRRRAEAASARPTSCASTCASSRPRASTRSSFIQQAGRNRHEHICEALELFAGEVMGEFKEREAARAKQEGRGAGPLCRGGDGAQGGDEAAGRRRDPAPVWRSAARSPNGPPARVCRPRRRTPSAAPGPRRWPQPIRRRSRPRGAHPSAGGSAS